MFYFFSLNKKWAIKIEDNDGSWQSPVRKWWNGQVAIRIFDKKNVSRFNNNKWIGKLEIGISLSHVGRLKNHEIVICGAPRAQRTDAKIAIVCREAAAVDNDDDDDGERMNEWT